MKRFFKHLAYGLLYLAILAGMAFWIYSANIKPPASCFDNIQNQAEEGVDCGGPCAKICLALGTKPMASDSSAKVFTLPNGLAGILFKVQNPNQDYAVKDFVYTVKISDASGAVIKTISDHSFIYAGEIKYISAAALSFGTSTPATATVETSDPVWIKASGFEKPILTIESPNTEAVGSNIQISGRLISKDTVTFPEVKIIAVLNDETGNQIGVSGTVIQNLAPLDVNNFIITHPNLEGLNLAGTQLFVYAMRP